MGSSLEISTSKQIAGEIGMKNILVVDDSELIRTQLHHILKAEGFNVLQAGSGSQVRTAFETEGYPVGQIDLILLDLYLEDESGLDLLQFLKTACPDIPVIMLSVEDERRSVLKALDNGAQDYLFKPFDKVLLIHKINFFASEGWKNSGDTLQTFRTMLSMEINRSIRSKLPFTLVKIEPRQTLGLENFFDFKEEIKEEIREIDQIYSIGRKCIVLLLPLTEPNGAKVVLKRLNDLLDSLECTSIHIYQFPERKISFKQLKFKKIPEYEEKVLEKLALDS